MASVLENWKHIETWRRLGKTFCVEIVHWTEPANEDFNPYDRGHRWNVYAYIWPNHPHFAAFSPEAGMFQPAASDLPLHWGPSLFDVIRDASGTEIKAFKVGCDYNHIHDEIYTQADTVERASDVFRDAEELFAWLESLQATPIGLDSI